MDNSQINRELQKDFESFAASMERTMKDKFKAEIQPGFLMKIQHFVLEAIAPWLGQIFDLRISEERLMTGDITTVSFDICNTIIGAHHANSIFLAPQEYIANQKNEEYQKRIVQQVSEMVILRQYAAVFFRKKSLDQLGERYIYYPVPYFLFVLSMRTLNILFQNSMRGDSANWEYFIIQKALAALTLLEDQFLDAAYMPCRTVIELFVKLKLFRKHPYLFAESQKFTNFDIDKTCCSQKYSKDFNELFYNRKHGKASKTEFLHYGFVDSIDRYHEIVRNTPYSIKGILQYLAADTYDYTKDMFERIDRLYTMCHGYAHGNVTISKYPLLHYFEISLILGEIVPRVYSMVCEDYNLPLKMEEYDVLKRFDSEFSLLKKQYNNRCDELFELEQKKTKR